jgi:hypothetical protein
MITEDHKLENMRKLSWPKLFYNPGTFLVGLGEKPRKPSVRIAPVEIRTGYLRNRSQRFY